MATTKKALTAEQKQKYNEAAKARRAAKKAAAASTPELTPEVIYVATPEQVIEVAAQQAAEVVEAPQHTDATPINERIAALDAEATQNAVIALADAVLTDEQKAEITVKAAAKTTERKAPTAIRKVQPSMTEEQALAEARKLFGETAMVWTMDADLNGKAYKTTRYRVGYKAETETGRFIEQGRRFIGFGGSWTAAVEAAKQYAPAAAKTQAA